MGIITSKTALGALALLAVTAMVFTACSAPVSDAESYDGELTLYGYDIHMGLKAPSQVTYVVWDFGDGSDNVTVTLDEDNSDGSTDHVFSSKGDYVVTATLHNTYKDSETGETKEGESKLVYLYHIMGFPVVTFESNGGTEIPKIEGTSSSYVPKKPADPVKEGSIFKGWYSEPDFTVEFDWSKQVGSHTTLYAKWEKITYDVTFDLKGGSGAIGSQTVAWGEFVIEPVSPTREGFAFKGWYLNGSEYDFTTKVYSSLALVADWTVKETDKVYRDITFDANGGTASRSSMVDILDGNSIRLPNAAKEGYDLEGWYLGDEKIGNAGDMYTVSSSITLKAHWTEAAPDSGDDKKGSSIWIVFAVLAVLCLIAAIATGMLFLGIPAVVLAIIATVLCLGVL